MKWKPKPTKLYKAYQTLLIFKMSTEANSLLQLCLWGICELTSLLVGNLRVGISASCPVTVGDRAWILHSVLWMLSISDWWNYHTFPYYRCCIGLLNLFCLLVKDTWKLEMDSRKVCYQFTLNWYIILWSVLITDNNNIDICCNAYRICGWSKRYWQLKLRVEAWFSHRFFGIKY